MRAIDRSHSDDVRGTVYRWAFSIAIAMMGMGTSISTAMVVTDNNLTMQPLGVLSNNPSQVSTNFTAPANTLIGVRSDVTMLTAGGSINNYHVDALSTSPTTTSTNDLVSTLGFFSPIPASYSKQHTLRLNTGAANTNLYYNLGVGTALNGMFGYTWQADNIAAYAPRFADSFTTNGVTYAGNLVPNASFEDTNINFFTLSTFLQTNIAKHGSMVLQITGTTERYISVPVTPGQTFYYSFWYAATGDSAVEWGFGVPSNGHSVTPGNSAAGAFGTFAERSGLLTPGPGQTTFYIGGNSNGGALWLDSLFVAVPEPSAVLLIAAGGCLLWRRAGRNG